ncbi:hypothetical protein Q7P37_000645 [Cladosporium fusiforme]
MGSGASSVDRAPDSARTSGQGYSDIIIRDNARAHLGNSIHNGDVVYVACERFCGSLSEVPASGTDESVVANAQRPLMKRKRSMYGEYDQRPDQRQQHALSAALKRLGEFSNSIQHHKLDKDARKVTKHLRVLLDALQDEGSAEGHAREELKRLKRCVIVAERVAINAASPRTAHTNVVKVDRKKDVIRFGRWQISLTTRIFHSRDAIGREAINTDSTIRVEPSMHTVGPAITVFVGERTDFFGKNFMHPTILAYRNVKNDSKVFELVKKDDLEGLITMLASQEATIRDCDEENRPLFNPAGIGAHDAANSCSKGVPIWTDTLGNPVILSMIQTIAVLDCYHQGDDVFQGAFEMMLEKGKMYIATDSAVPNGDSLWLHACARMSDASAPVKTMQSLLSEWVNTAETDSDGWNCLFFCVHRASDPSVSCELEILQLLLDRFDDIHARDKSGVTLFDYVNDEMTYSMRGSYRRDLWFCALERTGMLRGDEKRKIGSGKPRFTEDYTPLHSHALRFLDRWDESDVWPQVKSTLEHHPWSDEETAEMIKYCPGPVKQYNYWELRLSREHLIDISHYLGIDPYRHFLYFIKNDDWESCSGSDLLEEATDHERESDPGEDIDGRSNAGVEDIQMTDE